MKSTRSAKFSSPDAIKYQIETKNITYLSQSPPAFYLLFVEDSDDLWFCWWREAAANFTASSPKLVKEATVYFRRRVDDLLLEEIAIEVNSHSLQVQALRDGPYFVRHFQGTDLPEPLFPIGPFVGRAVESGQLYERLRPGTAVSIIGPPESGKTQFIAHFLSSASNVTTLSQKVGRNIGLVVIDPSAKIGDHRLLRALAFSLGLGKLDSLEPNSSLRADLVGQGLPFRLQQVMALLVIDNWQHCLSSTTEVDDLAGVLSCSSVRAGVAIILSRARPPQNTFGKMPVAVEVRLGPLAKGEAIALLSSLIEDFALAERGVDSCRGLEELLLPGIISKAAHEFNQSARSADFEPAEVHLLDLLMDAASGSVIEFFRSMGFSSLLGPGGGLAPLGNIVAMAIVAELDFDHTLSDHRLADLLNSLSTEGGWVIRSGMIYRIGTLMKLALRNEARSAFQSAEVGAALVLGVHRILHAASETLVESEQNRFSSAVEEALAWSRRELPREVSSVQDLEAILLRQLVPFVIDDSVLPVTEEEWKYFSGKLYVEPSSAEIDGILPALVLSARLGASSEEFLGALQRAVGSIATARSVRYYHLRALDLAAYYGLNRFGLFSAILDIRRAVAARLMEWVEQRPGDKGLVKWSVSWLLNLGTSAARMSDMAQAQEASDLAEDLLSAKMGSPGSRHGALDWLWLNARLSLLQARIEVERGERVAKLMQARGYAARLVRISDEHPKWVKFYLRSARRVLGEVRTDQDRGFVINDVLQCLSGEFGGREKEWLLDVRCQAAALIRDAGSLNCDPEARLNWARLAVSLLAIWEASEAGEQGDIRPLLVLARCTAFEASCLESDGKWPEALEVYEKSLSLCQKALALCPSVQSWVLALELREEIDTMAPKNMGDVEAASGPEAPIGAELRRDIAACRRWLRTIRYVGHGEGRLLLWCQQREWKSQGSLERWIKKSRVPEEVWTTMRVAHKHDLLKEEFETRRSALNSIEAKFGPFHELYIARAWGEAQYQRLVAVYGNHIVDSAAVIAHFRMAEEVLPFSENIMAEEAKFYTYVWDYPNAISCLRRAIAASSGGSYRRDLIVAIVANLIRAASHWEHVAMPDGVILSARDLFQEAEGYISEVMGFGKVALDVSILHDRLKFESGGELDWEQLDAMYALVVGDVRKYVETVIGNISILRHEIRGTHGDIPRNVAELMRTDYTNTRVLSGMGNLYMRRAEEGGGSDPILDYKKAYAVFDACRVLETSMVGGRDADYEFSQKPCDLYGCQACE